MYLISESNFPFSLNSFTHKVNFPFIGLFHNTTGSAHHIRHDLVYLYQTRTDIRAEHYQFDSIMDASQQLQHQRRS